MIIITDFLSAGGPGTVFSSASDPVLLTMLAAGGALTGGFPFMSTRYFEFSLNRVFIFTMFLLWPRDAAALFTLASVALGAGLRIAFPIGRFWRFLLGGLLALAVLYSGPELIISYRPELARQLAVLLALPFLLVLEITMNIICSREASGPGTCAGRLMITYAATLLLSLMAVIMIIRSGMLGTALVLLVFTGFSFIGRSINRKHEWNTERISRISRQDRLATRLMESSSCSEFLDILGKELFPSGGSDVMALARTGEEDGWILWTRTSHTALSGREVKGAVPEKGRLSGDLIAGDLRGTALGLSDKGDLVLLLTGPEQEVLSGMPSSLLENLVLLLEHTWEAVGHAVRSRRAFLAAAVMLARLADAKDDYTHGHSLRVAGLSCALGRHLGLSPAKLQTLRVASILHDIGKLAIPASILTKRGLLTRKEREIVEAHPLEGAEIVSGLSGYEEVSRIILGHHERIDGKGYPEGLTGPDIPFMARIVAVADTFDAITSDRSYHAVSGREEALESIKAEMGDKFDARIVEALESVIDRGFEEMA